MNFLAHLYLSGSHPEVMVGNFLGDFVKGKEQLKTFDNKIIKGIELHREIDTFTDHHTVVRESKLRLREKYRHYSGVIVDMFYDHFLSAGWKNYHSDTLANFAEIAYQNLRRHESVFPERAKEVLPYIVKGNWLVSYASTEGIHRALSGMARRTAYPSRMNEAVDDLILHYKDFQKEFQTFFPDLQAYAAQWREENNV